MATDTLTYTGTLAIEECCNCHITFAMPADFRRRCVETGQTFWCPLGHAQSYTGSEVDRLRARLADEERRRKSAEARETHQRDQRQAAERSAAAYKGRVTRLKNRAAAGVCPCCNRSFENLRRHMSARHPDFAEREGLAALETGPWLTTSASETR